MNKHDYDFGGWVTKNDLQCSDNRIIGRDAFKHDDGVTVPLVWNHQHNSPENILGNVLLENRPEGVYGYGKFNDSQAGSLGKMLVQHGDIVSLSICANQLKQAGHRVEHGKIREVSLVLAGANPGAFIDTVMAHGDGSETDEAIIYTGEEIDLFHAEDDENEKEEKKEEVKEEKPEEGEKKERTVGDVLDSLNEEQKMVVLALLERAKNGDKEEKKEEEEPKKESKEEDDEEDKTVKHNLFENDDQSNQQRDMLTHADQVDIINNAKNRSIGSFKAALELYAREHSDTLQHGVNPDQIEMLFPEFKDVKPGAPELLTTDQGWISHVLNKVHKSPISRIRTRQADIRDITALRAQGYEKGTQKKFVGNFNLVSRTTDPTTVYVKSKLERDDIIDITDFDIVQYMYGIDRQNLNEELATAILLGDGREEGTEGKIDETKIRPIWTDDELYTLHADVDIETMRDELQGSNTSAYFGENYIYAEAIIQTLLYTREKYKGSGQPDFYCTPHLLNVMLLARDMNGRRIYDNVNDIKAALNVGQILTVEQFEGKTRTVTVNGNEKTKKLLAIMCNLNDYYLGATKGGEITHFTDFDLNFNQEISLLETRCSGANTRVFSAIALEEDITGQPSNP